MLTIKKIVLISLVLFSFAMAVNSCQTNDEPRTREDLILGDWSLDSNIVCYQPLNEDSVVHRSSYERGRFTYVFDETGTGKIVRKESQMIFWGTTIDYDEKISLEPFVFRIQGDTLKIDFFSEFSQKYAYPVDFVIEKLTNESLILSEYITSPPANIFIPEELYTPYNIHCIRYYSKINR